MTNPATTYESFMVPVLFRPWAFRLVDAAALRPGARVLDVGCGTGVVAREAARRLGPGAAVTGLDVSPQMLEVARERGAAEGLAIEWREGRAEELPFEDGAFDFVLSQFALMFFSDRDAGLREMRRVLADGGEAVVSVWQSLERHPFYAALDAAIRRQLGLSAVRDIFVLGDESGLRELVARAGFTDVRIEQATMESRFRNPDAFLAGEIDVDTAAIPSMQGLDAAGRERVVSAIREDMADPLRSVTRGDEVVLSFHAHIVRGQR